MLAFCHVLEFTCIQRIANIKSLFQHKNGMIQSPVLQNSLFELPLLPAHGALVLGLLGAQPLHDAVDVEAVAALTPHLIKYASQTLPYNTNQRAIIPSKFAIGTASVESDPAKSIDNTLRRASQSNAISSKCGCFWMGVPPLF